MIELQGVRARKGSFLLEIPSWKVSPGTVVGVVGPNGAGKTTLLELLPGLAPADEGTVRVFGHDPMARPAEVRSQLGFMSDDLPLFNMRINRLLWTLSGYYPSWDDSLVGKLLTRFKLDEKRKVSELSKGEATRIRLLTALAFRPKLLVLDEPATGLDVGGRRALLQTVLEVVDDKSCSVVVSSHQLADVERIADQLLVVDDGCIVKNGATDELVGDHRTLEEALLAWGAAG
ncbi:MAG: ABC transporter ATP-binding protein [Proteobacteria bacterium]|nr:ABC transporter ATP-binding protein [Pseudomonadota bacterium]